MNFNHIGGRQDEIDDSSCDVVESMQFENKVRSGFGDWIHQGQERDSHCSNAGQRTEGVNRMMPLLFQVPPGNGSITSPSHLDRRRQMPGACRQGKAQSCRAETPCPVAAGWKSAWTAARVRAPWQNESPRAIRTSQETRPPAPTRAFPGHSVKQLADSTAEVEQWRRLPDSSRGRRPAHSVPVRSER